jgi:hypothetical protein
MFDVVARARVGVDMQLGEDHTCSPLQHWSTQRKDVWMAQGRERRKWKRVEVGFFLALVPHVCGGRCHSPSYLDAGSGGSVGSVGSVDSIDIRDIGDIRGWTGSRGDGVEEVQYIQGKAREELKASSLVSKTLALATHTL